MLNCGIHWVKQNFMINVKIISQRFESGLPYLILGLTKNGDRITQVYKRPKRSRGWNTCLYARVKCILLETLTIKGNGGATLCTERGITPEVECCTDQLRDLCHITTRKRILFRSERYVSFLLHNFHHNSLHQPEVSFLICWFTGYTNSNRTSQLTLRISAEALFLAYEI